MVAHHPFSFLQDLAFDIAQFLVSTAGKQDGLEGALMLDECLIPLQECERLDQSLALALNHLTLPHGWSLLGHKLNSSTGECVCVCLCVCVCACLCVSVFPMNILI